MGSSPYAVEMKGITKRFPGVVANDGIDFALRRGEIRALLGENGAGKSTLMNILSGMYRPDSGEIWIEGRQVTLDSPRAAINLGIGMVHQHFMLVNSLTVTENIILGQRSSREPFTDIATARARIEDISVAVGLEVDPDARVWQLSVGERQRVEIIKTLYRGARVLILDEPTSVLTPQEADCLFVMLRRMAQDGYTVVFVSHKLNEVIGISDRVTILRSGKVISTVETQETDVRGLARLMVGRDVVFRLDKSPVQMGAPVLEVESISARNDKDLEALRGVSLTVHAGEILGIAGVAGNGQRELAEVLGGVRRVTRGRILIRGKDISNRSAEGFLRAGGGHIPEDRRNRGLIGDFSLTENLIMESFGEPCNTLQARLPVLGRWFIDRKAVCQRADELIALYDVRVPSRDVLASKLSGGNQQKIVLARTLSREPQVLIACKPTMGLDVGATEYVRRKLLEQRGLGKAILLISEDLDEILMLSDRIAVIYEGVLSEAFLADGVELEQIGLMMGGSWC